MDHPHVSLCPAPPLAQDSLPLLLIKGITPAIILSSASSNVLSRDCSHQHTNGIEKLIFKKKKPPFPPHSRHHLSANHAQPEFKNIYAEHGEAHL